MDKPDKYIQLLYSEGLTQRQWEAYLKGNLPPVHKQAIERYLAQHPLEAEALEGLRTLDSQELATDLKELQHRIQFHTGQQKEAFQPLPKFIQLLPYNPLNIAVAATVSVILISVVLLLFLRTSLVGKLAVAPENPKTEAVPSNALADREEKKQEPVSEKEPSVQNTQSVTQTTEVTEPTFPSQQPVVEDQQRASGQDRKADGLSNYLTQNERNRNASVRDLRRETDRAAQREEVKSDDVSKKMKAVRDQPAQAKPQSLEVVQGRVTEADGSPLPGVVVSVPGTSQTGYTNAEGFYQLAVPNGSTLHFSFVGFQGKELTATGPQLNVIMQEDAQTLSEVVVVSYETKFKEEEGSSFASSEPVGGFSRYKQYIRSQLRYPDSARVNQIEGRVVLTFFVEPDSQLTDLKITRSLGYGCDQEALRLVREGPRWNPAYNLKEKKAVRQKIRLRIRFKF
jgi:TonB family protein